MVRGCGRRVLGRASDRRFSGAGCSTGVFYDFRVSVLPGLSLGNAVGQMEP